MRPVSFHCSLSPLPFDKRVADADSEVGNTSKLSLWQCLRKPNSLFLSSAVTAASHAVFFIMSCFQEVQLQLVFGDRLTYALTHTD